MDLWTKWCDRKWDELKADGEMVQIWAERERERGGAAKRWEGYGVWWRPSDTGVCGDGGEERGTRGRIFMEYKEHGFDIDHVARQL